MEMERGGGGRVIQFSRIPDSMSPNLTPDNVWSVPKLPTDGGKLMWQTVD